MKNQNVIINERGEESSISFSVEKWNKLRFQIPFSGSGVIHNLDAGQSKRILKHLVSLSGQDRYQRFGYAIRDEQIARYVDELNYEQDEIYGVLSDRLEIVGLAHLAFQECASKRKQIAEFGVSVLPKYRGLKLGTRLFERACEHARNNKVQAIFIQALSENLPMLKIAKKYGAVIQRGGFEAEAYVELNNPTLNSLLSELIKIQYAKNIYDLKEQFNLVLDLASNYQALAAELGGYGFKKIS
jgi:GNAT superfamily N-acetyltransferase